ncbi:MAG TPA: hypothetical protein VF203_00560 [Burkholderiales bacterium]
MTGARSLLLAALLALAPASVRAHATEPAPASCGAGGLQLQVLGSGGPELAGGRAASSHLVWVDGKARVLVDFGPGAALRFAQSGARASDLDVALFTRVHAGHTLDFPALVAAALREERRRTLPVYGPPGGRLAPSTVNYTRALLDGARGAYRHLGIVLNPLAAEGFRLDPHDARAPTERVGVRRERAEIWEVHRSADLRVSATALAREGAPALAWRVVARGRRIVFIDTPGAGESGRLVRFAANADVVVAGAHTPAALAGIARLAERARAKHLIVAGGVPTEMRGNGGPSSYRGPVAYAEDLACFPVP